MWFCEIIFKKHLYNLVSELGLDCNRASESVIVFELCIKNNRFRILPSSGFEMTVIKGLGRGLLRHFGVAHFGRLTSTSSAQRSASQC